MRKLTWVLISLLIISFTAFLGCGSSTSNDQGVTFTFFGWFDPAAGGEDPEQFTSAAYSLGSTGFSNTPSFILAAGVQNNLYSQGIRIQKIHHKYEALGSDLQIPTTSVVASGFMGPNSDNSSGAFDQDSSLPDSFVGEGTGPFGTTYYIGAPIITNSIANFLSLNRESLPQRPFSLIVTSYASGVTTSGEVIQSNDFQFEIIVINDIDIIDSAGGSSVNAEADAVTEPTEENGVDPVSVEDSGEDIVAVE